MVWSIRRRRSAWRAWIFLAVVVVVNALLVIQRAALVGPEYVGHELRYYTEAALAVALAIAFAFAQPRLRARVEPVEPDDSAEAAALRQGVHEPAPKGTRRLPSARVAATALASLAAYVGVTLATTDSMAKRFAAEPNNTRIPSGRLARDYFDNLRADLAAAYRSGTQFSLLDHDVPQWVQAQLFNAGATRYTLLSSVVPLVDDDVTFNGPGPLYIVQPDGHLRETRFIPAAGGSVAELERAGRLRIRLARVERAGGEWCVVGENLGAAVEWQPRPVLRGRDWWLQARYRTETDEPFELETNSGLGWAQGGELPRMADPDTVTIPLESCRRPRSPPTPASVSSSLPLVACACSRLRSARSIHPRQYLALPHRLCSRSRLSIAVSAGGRPDDTQPIEDQQVHLGAQKAIERLIRRVRRSARSR